MYHPEAKLFNLMFSKYCLKNNRITWEVAFLNNHLNSSCHHATLRSKPEMKSLFQHKIHTFIWNSSYLLWSPTSFRSSNWTGSSSVKPKNGIKCKIIIFKEKSTLYSIGNKCKSLSSSLFQSRGEVKNIYFKTDW